LDIIREYPLGKDKFLKGLPGGRSFLKEDGRRAALFLFSTPAGRKAFFWNGQEKDRAAFFFFLDRSFFHVGQKVKEPSPGIKKIIVICIIPPISPFFRPKFLVT